MDRSFGYLRGPAQAFDLAGLKPPRFSPIGPWRWGGAVWLCVSSTLFTIGKGTSLCCALLCCDVL